MSNELRVLIDGAETGTLVQGKNGKLSFSYDDAWINNAAAIPLSLSMPLPERHHLDRAVRPYLSGLLPDSEQTLEQIGKRFGVSPRNPFAMISNIGEDLQGAVQIVPADQAANLKTREGITWLSREDIGRDLAALMRDPGRLQFTADGGRFSLAGAQRKKALCLEDGKWGEPRGRTATTHILKPSIAGLPGQAENEMFCLRLAPLLGLPAPPCWVETFGGLSVIIIERYDRIKIHNGKSVPLSDGGGQVLRVHQEDMCQALAVLPNSKYQRDGGPGMVEIMNLLASPIDRDRFIRACVFNWVIGATDAHAKNYSVLLGTEKQVRLAPLYDVASWLPYDQEGKAKLAMSVAGYYDYNSILLRHWEEMAKKCRFDADRLRFHIRDLLERLPDAVVDLRRTLEREMPPSPEFEALCNLLVTRNGLLKRTYWSDLSAPTK